MSDILLLREASEYNCKIKEYLRLGGCNVREEDLFRKMAPGEIQQYDMVILSIGIVDECSSVILDIRKETQKPILVLSDINDEWKKIRLFRLGIDDYMVEPFSHGELMARVQAHISRYKRLTRPFGIIKIRDLEINALSRSVSVDGKDVELRIKEFDVLLYIAQRMDEVVTKEEIYESIWKEEMNSHCCNTVAVHIKKVREKIEKDITNPRYIETVWGYGYRMRSKW